MSDVFGPYDPNAYDGALDAAEWTSETFQGPTLTLELSGEPDPSSLTVEGPDGPAIVDVEGRTITRVPGHFGRGRWTATYLPN